MKQKMREISLILGTGITAVACSQFMQHADQIFAQLGVSTADAAVPHIARPVSDGHLASALGTRPVLTMAPTRTPVSDLPLPEMPEDRIYSASFSGEGGLDQPAQARLQLAQATSCAAPVLKLEPSENGMISVEYTDACNGGVVASLTQPGLQFDVKLDAQGQWSGLVPAMLAQARLTVASAGGVASAGIVQPEADDWNRVVLSWARPVAMHLSARKGDTEGTPDGYVTRFSAVGDGQQAEVYSTRLALGETRLSVDAPVTGESCGQTLEGGIAWADRSKLHPVTAVNLMMPECDQQGGSVVMDLPDLSKAGQ
ncbi:hypothetical protein ABEB22_05065 [Thioclava sp. 'Guangxiensis']|uniref:hypothetical protein n=1 Tax=Thioclava sp. 'Guangxiensis' TaxID=3149044 RepID=UPI003878075A